MWLPTWKYNYPSSSICGVAVANHDQLTDSNIHDLTLGTSRNVTPASHDDAPPPDQLTNLDMDDSNLTTHISGESSTNSNSFSNCEEDHNKPNTLRNSVRFAVINARSVAPKLKSLVEIFKERDLAFAVVTESWLVDGHLCDQVTEELELGHGISSICQNRKNTSGRNTGGGVAIMAKKNILSLKNYPVKRNGCEIAVGQSR